MAGDSRKPEAAGERRMFQAEHATTLPAPSALAESGRATLPESPQSGASPPSSTAAGAALRPAYRRFAGRPLGFSAMLAAGPSRARVSAALLKAVSTELDRGTAFLLAPIVIAFGAAAYFSGQHEPGWGMLLAANAVMLPVALITRSRPGSHLLATAILLFSTGLLVAKLETWRASTKMLGAEIATELTGRVEAVERLASGRVRLTIQVLGTARPQLRFAPERVRVSARNIPAGATAGSLVRGLARLMPPSGPVRPGSYDYSFESYFDGIGASGFFLRGPELVEGAASPTLRSGLGAAVERAREHIAQRIRLRIGGPEGEIAAALVVGVRAGIPEEINEALRRAGIYHIISISGLHMALVAGTIMWLLRAGFGLFPSFSARWPVKKLSAGLAIAGLGGYLFISGGGVAAQRSFIMLAVMLTAVLFVTRKNGWHLAV